MNAHLPLGNSECHIQFCETTNLYLCVAYLHVSFGDDKKAESSFQGEMPMALSHK